MTVAAADYRVVLEQVFEQRRQANPSYSWRAFARDLGLAASQLSEVMKGVHGLSAAKASIVAQRLGLAEPAAAAFIDLVEVEHARDPRRRKAALKRIERRREGETFQTISLDTFQLIADWYHLAILELMKTRLFRSEIAWIARALSLPMEAAQGAVSRLRRLRLLQQDGARLLTVTPHLSTSMDVPSQAIRSFHAQILGKAKDALARQSVEEREFGTLLVPLRIDQLPEAKRLIRAFQEQFSAAFHASTEREEVFALAVQLFRLSDARAASASDVER